jgi:hypothetical protein
MLEQRAPAGVGGTYSYYCPGTVSLDATEPNTYRSIDLAFFDEWRGWCAVVVDGEYGPPSES